VPEQINSLPFGVAGDEGKPQGADYPTGMLVPKGDVKAMSEAIRLLLTDETLRLRLSINASQEARRCFSLDQQVNTYLSWYEEILDQRA
jgi:glycosyltransferase involved in cell wall biosynthesis